MRGVFVFPLADRERVELRLAQPAPPGIVASIQTTADGLFSDWEPAALAKLEAALGHRPDWCVVCDVSGQIPGDEEIRAVTLDLLADGGVAVDDYSDHPWTTHEIAEDHRVDGLGFFDYRAAADSSRSAHATSPATSRG